MRSEAHARRVAAFEAVPDRRELSFTLLGDPREELVEQQGVAVTAAQRERAVDRR